MDATIRKVVICVGLIAGDYQLCHLAVSRQQDPAFQGL
jgi:hypothetical protein